MIREAVQKFSESARLPPIDDLHSMRQSSYPVLVLKELCYTALFANPGNTIPENTLPENTPPISALVPSLSSPCTPPRVGQARVVDTNDDVIRGNQLSREPRGRVEEENRSHLRRITHAARHAPN